MSDPPPDPRLVDQLRGCLLGGAVGDALGAPVEFLSWPQIEARFGSGGIGEMAEAYGRVGAITDDTQMTLWTAEGILRGIVRGNEREIGGPMSTIPHAYLRWLYTQDGWLPDDVAGWERRYILGSDDPDRRVDAGWLIGVRALHARRAPGNTCLSALRDGRFGGRARNDSKGCGGVMRVAPAALLRDAAPEDAFALACEAAALTHGHPTGWLAAGAFAWMLALVRAGVPLLDAVEDARHRVGAEEGSAETAAAIAQAVRLARGRRPTTAATVEALGGAWIAEEALAIAVFAALRADGDFERGVRIAVNHSGDSDSTGSMAGQLLGLQLGAGAIPARWLEPLELREEITAIADDLAIGYRPGGEWWTRYPGF